jgi:hypothetical protein
MTAASRWEPHRLCVPSLSPPYTTLQLAPLGSPSHVSSHEVALCLDMYEIRRSSVCYFLSDLLASKTGSIQVIRFVANIACPGPCWKIVSLDFIEGLPLSEGFNSIPIILDLFSKYAHFVGL